MIRPPRTAREAIKRNFPYIKGEIEQGVALNTIRKKLMADRNIKVSRSYFNEVVSELVEMNNQVTTVTTSASQSARDLEAFKAHRTPNEKIGGNLTDTRFKPDF